MRLCEAFIQKQENGIDCFILFRYDKLNFFFSHRFSAFRKRIYAFFGQDFTSENCRSSQRKVEWAKYTHKTKYILEKRILIETMNRERKWNKRNKRNKRKSPRTGLLSVLGALFHDSAESFFFVAFLSKCCFPFWFSLACWRAFLDFCSML